MVWSPCCPRDSQESSPTPQFKNINSLALSFLYSPTLKSIHDYWKNHSFNKTGAHLTASSNSASQVQQYLNRELPDVQAGFRKVRGIRDQIANIHWIVEKAREFQKNIYFCFIDYAKALDCVDHNKLWTILKEMGIPDHLTSLLRNLYAGQEATVKTGHGTTDWFQIGKGVRQGYNNSLKCEAVDWNYFFSHQHYM